MFLCLSLSLSPSRPLAHSPFPCLLFLSFSINIKSGIFQDSVAHSRPNEKRTERQCPPRVQVTIIHAAHFRPMGGYSRLSMRRRRWRTAGERCMWMTTTRAARRKMPSILLDFDLLRTLRTSIGIKCRDGIVMAVEKVRLRVFAPCALRSLS
jgi:hypothetical protein